MISGYVLGSDQESSCFSIQGRLVPHRPGNAHLLLPLESNFVFGDGCLLDLTW